MLERIKYTTSNFTFHTYVKNSMIRLGSKPIGSNRQVSLSACGTSFGCFSVKPIIDDRKSKTNKKSRLASENSSVGRSEAIGSKWFYG